MLICDKTRTRIFDRNLLLHVSSESAYISSYPYGVNMNNERNIFIFPYSILVGQFSLNEDLLADEWSIHHHIEIKINELFEWLYLFHSEPSDLICIELKSTDRHERAPPKLFHFENVYSHFCSSWSWMEFGMCSQKIFLYFPQ